MSTILFRATLEGRAAIKKNSLQRKYSFAKRRTFTLPSDRYLAWENSTVLELKSLWGWRDPIDEPVILRARFYFKNHAHEPDLSNLYEGVQDALQKAGIILNDKIIQGHDGSRKVFGEGPRVEIEIIAMEV
jgi:Holliday junction resolvase RusA-like endonuclease